MYKKKNSSILILSFEMPPFITGGIGSVAYETVRGFERLGYKIILIAPKNDNLKTDLNCIYHSIPIKNNLIKTLIMLLKSIKVFIKDKPVFIYSLSGTYCGIVCFIINKIFKSKYFIVAHGMEFIRFEKNIIIKNIIKKIYNLSSKVFSVSNFTKEKLISFGVNSNNIYVCYNGVNTNKFYKLTKDCLEDFRKSKNLENNKFYLLTISRLDKRKGHINVLKALKNIFDSKPELKNEIFYLIGGKGETYTTLNKYINENNLNDNVIMLGFIQEKDINSFYNTCSLFIHPNIYIQKSGNVEGFGLVFLEAAASGKTSIGGLSGGSTEAIINGITGVTVDGNNINEIQNNILDLFYDQNKLNLLSENAYNNSITNFNWDIIIKNIDKEINKNL